MIFEAFLVTFIMLGFLVFPFMAGANSCDVCESDDSGAYLTGEDDSGDSGI